MPSDEWDERLKAMLKKTGEDFKKVGNDIKASAQQLLTQAKDPETQKKVREKLSDVGDWAKKTGEELAGMVDQGLKKAEVVFNKATDKVSDAVGPKAAAPKPKSEPVSAQKVAAPDEIREAKPAKKTVGKGSKKKASAKKAGAAKKTIGKSVAPAPGPGDTADDDAQAND